LQRDYVDEGWFSVLVACQHVLMWTKLHYFAKVFNPTKNTIIDTIRIGEWTAGALNPNAALVWPGARALSSGVKLWHTPLLLMAAAVGAADNQNPRLS
jgi:hypothetical protein